MHDNYFPTLDEFYDRFCNAVTQSGSQETFTHKWGLERLADIDDLLRNNVQGGYDSHKHTMLSAPTGGTVLNLGPGMGFCVFLLSELFDSVFVAEPDQENCTLLNRIAHHYETHKNKKAREIVTVYHAGISITAAAVDYWKTKRELMKKRNLQGSILNFSIEGASELQEIMPEKVDRLYLHKVLSSLSISNTFAAIISQSRLFLKEDGVITWSEPGYVFEDLLQVEEPNTLETVLKDVLEKNQLVFHLKNYQLTGINKETGQKNLETWISINAHPNKFRPAGRYVCL
jgi:hypothetical protein